MKNIQEESFPPNNTKNEKNRDRINSQRKKERKKQF
jgi:hypothetical protein